MVACRSLASRICRKPWAPLWFWSMNRSPRCFTWMRPLAPDGCGQCGPRVSPVRWRDIQATPPSRLRSWTAAWTNPISISTDGPCIGRTIRPVLVVKRVSGAGTLSLATAVNTIPVAGTNIIIRGGTNGVKVSLAALLANDTDADSDTLSISAVSSASTNGGTEHCLAPARTLPCPHFRGFA